MGAEGAPNRSCRSFRTLGFEFWSFSGAWILDVGAFLVDDPRFQVVFPRNP